MATVWQTWQKTAAISLLGQSGPVTLAWEGLPLPRLCPAKMRVPHSHSEG